MVHGPSHDAMAVGTLPRSARLFVAAVAVAGALVLPWAGLTLWLTHPSLTWLLLALLTIVSSSFPLRAPGVAASLSLSEALVFTSILTFGPAPAIVTVALDGLTLSLKQSEVKLERVLFNVTQPAVSLWLAYWAFSSIVPHYTFDGSPQDVVRVLVGLIVLASTTFLATSGFNAMVVALSMKRPFWSTWAQLRWVALNYFAGVSLASLLTQRAESLNLVALGLLAPLLGVFYLTFSNWVARTEEAREHLDRLNKLYLSTIETLAMAIDAKDQITHGHIRRVQLLATGLAKRLGIEDAAELKAIEAAALLHDMGKLAIPEHILNKPGKLSAAEFEQMKQHASIGADILSRIDFPYPVVPIVRHHHEWWNGGGYPDGIVGATIPIGARILSVVDCYDALTSDRPYRRALTDEQAFEILYERRGSMYDPLVVDMFAKVYLDILPSRDEVAALHASLGELRLDAVPKADAPARAPEPQADEGARMFLARLHRLASASAVGEVTSQVAADLMAQTPARLVAFFLYEHATDTLLASFAFGQEASHVRGLRVAMGERLSGWVAANKRTICNSDAALDLAALERPMSASLRSALGAPLVADGQLVGVVTLYAEPLNGFADAHQRLLEHALPTLARLLSGVLELEMVQKATQADVVLALPSVEAALDLSASAAIASTAAMTVTLMSTGSDTSTPVAMPPDVVATLQRHLRPEDRLLRCGTSEVVAMLEELTPAQSVRVVERLRDRLLLALQACGLDATRSLGIGLAASREATTLGDMLDLARRRATADALGASGACDSTIATTTPDAALPRAS
ncbi:MAG: HD domain-containing protein [Vicinamibacterales bacterium]